MKLQIHIWALFHFFVLIEIYISFIEAEISSKHANLQFGKKIVLGTSGVKFTKMR